MKQNEFLEKAIKKHGDKYDYSKVNYVNNKIKIVITCPDHGDFKQIPNDHLNGSGCPKCSKINGNTKLTYTTNDFIQKAINKHGNKYDYSKVKYTGSTIKICIVCPQHGEFYQTPSSHLRGYGCKLCGFETISNVKMYNINKYIQKCSEKHNHKYDYSHVNSVNGVRKINIICPEHGVFSQSPVEHLRGYGCPICGGTHKLTTEAFILKAKECHGDKYDYGGVVYVNNRSKIRIVCPVHGAFYQTPHAHLSNQGCPICKESKLEKEIRNLLDDNNISYEVQKKFVWLGRQSLDFYLPKYNVAIECQGAQHFIDNAWDHKGTLLKIIKMDELKKELCHKNGVEIKYYSNLAIKYPYQVFEDKKELINDIQNG